MPPLSPSDKKAVVLGITVICGLIGGLLAAPLTDIGDVDVGWKVLIFIVSTAVGASVAFGLLTREPRIQEQPKESDKRLPWPPPKPPSGPVPGPPAIPPPAIPSQSTRQPGTPSHVAVPLPGGAKGGAQSWWERSGSNSAPKHAAAPATPVSHVPLSSYAADRALIAQCPRCGGFELDMARHGEQYSFRCRNAQCGNELRWTPGSPWPAVVVRRNLTGK